MCSSQRVAAMVAHRRHTWCFAAVVLWLTHCYAHAARCGGLACSNSSIPRVSAPVLLCGEGAADDDPVDMRLFADTAGDVRGLNTPVVSTTTLRAGGAQQVVLALAQVQVSAHLIAVRLDDASPGARARKGGEAAAGSGGWDGKGAAGGAAGAETGGVSRRAGLSDAQYPCSHDVLAWPPVEVRAPRRSAACARHAHAVTARCRVPRPAAGRPAAAGRVAGDEGRLLQRAARARQRHGVRRVRQRRWGGRRHQARHYLRTTRYALRAPPTGPTAGAGRRSHAAPRRR